MIPDPHASGSQAGSVRSEVPPWKSPRRWRCARPGASRDAAPSDCSGSGLLSPRGPDHLDAKLVAAHLTRNGLDGDEVGPAWPEKTPLEHDLVLFVEG